MKDRQRGTALVIVLAFIVLLTGLLVAYLSLSRTDRQLSSSSFNGAKVDQLAASALDIIVGDLKQEIANGSTATTIGNQTVYSSTANANLLPVRSGNPPAVGGVDPIPNLIRISTRTETGIAPLVSSRASALATTVPSTNGRSITLSRWNQHYLIPRISGEAGTAAFKSDPVASFTSPDWVFVTSQGPQVITSATTSVIGRYGYAIYDEGGALDLNVAGFPSGTSPTQEGGKGNIAYADLTVLGLTQAQIDNIVGWRNYASAQPTGDFASNFVFGTGSANQYFNMVTNNAASGFMKVAGALWNGRTDQTFVSRQNLINFWSSKNLPPDVLQYVGTFSREKNAPSWSPPYDAPSLGGTAGTAYAYKSNAEDTTATPANRNNRDVLNVRQANSGTITSYALDGTPATIPVQAGDPVVRKRFCLGRLAWLTYQGPNPAIANAAAAIKQHFGLVWGTGPEGLPCWVYTSPTGTGTTGTTASATSIKTLSEVAALSPPREPDFFELLKAGILNGSLGLSGGPYCSAIPGVNGPMGDTDASDSTPDYQIFQIGADIIDQYDSDSYPTEIAANVPPMIGFAVYGIENLPYIYGIHLANLRDSTNFARVGGWFVPEIWNPHQNTTSSMPTSPGNFRFIGTGTCFMWISGPTGLAPIISSDQDLSTDTSGVQFTINPIEPTLLLQSNATSENPANLITSYEMSTPPYYVSPSRAYVGIFASSVIDTSTNDKPSGVPDYYFSDYSTTGLNFYLQYQDTSGNWRTYTVMKKIKFLHGNGTYSDLITGAGGSYYAARSDPRTDRFSLSEIYQTYGSGVGNGAGLPNRTLWPDAAGKSFNALLYNAPSTPHFIYNGPPSPDPTTTFYNNPWQFSENRPNPSGTGTQGNGTTYYTDIDGVDRRADGAYAVTGSSDGHPLAMTTQPSTVPALGATFPGNTGAMASRPVLLNHPFRSVGELGYAFRDEPWKHIDFFTPESADSALLDLFSVDDGDVTAGRVSLNTRQAPVLQAILSGALKNGLTSSTISAPDALALAQAIVADTTSTAPTAGPLINRSALVNQFKSAADVLDSRTFISSLALLPFSATTDNTVKAQRESIIRALGDATTTRTWNLMIDVVAQSGHYPPGASASTPLSQFVVDGEHRYWLHIAIDRFTGAVLDQVLEPVYE